MTRYWVTLDNICIREWSQEEYNTLNPTDSITEDVLYNVCMCCGKPKSIAVSTVSTLDCKIVKSEYASYCIECMPKLFRPKRNNGYRKIKTKLRCIEFTEREIDGKMCQWTQLY